MTGVQTCALPIFETFATEEYKQRFPFDYQRFIAKSGDAVVGTPIELMPGLSVSQKAEFRAMNIRTVEDLAEIPDTTRVLGVHELKRKAKAYLDVSRDEAIATKAAETNAQLKKQELELAQSKAELAAMKEQVATLLASQTTNKKKSEEV